VTTDGGRSRVMLRPSMQRLLLLAAATLTLACVASPVRAADGPELRFVRDGQTVRALAAPALEAACGAVTIQVNDPYYGKEKSFRACPLAAVLKLGFGVPAADLAGENFFFRAKDGYARPASGKVLGEPGGYVAFADASLPPGQWEPVDRRQLDPGPFYVVWTGEKQRDPHLYPWPYQLVTVEIAPFEREYPHTSPTGLPPDAPAWSGFQIFRGACIACHAINGEGGTVGPDLNVPQSIVEYRPRDQVKAYIRDPEKFRYTTMPAHPDLTPQQLDALLAYFDAMAARKHDPGSPKKP
jgi:mono/diheme cytochrome c family protein